jgi:sugar phosphate isomerase/epimerase
MKLGISSYTYSWAVGIPGYPPREPLSVPALLDRAIELDVRVVQIADNLPLHALPEADLDEAAAFAEENELAIEVGTRGMAAGNLERYLALAQRLQSPILRVVAGPDESDYGFLRKSIARILPACRDAGVVLAFENYELFRARELADFIASFETDAIGVCLDTTNSLGAGEGLREVVEALAPLTVNLHVKDFAIHRADHRLGFIVEGRPAGQGQMDVPWLLGRLREFGRNPNAIVELWTPPEADVAATVVKEARWAAESVRSMQTLIQDCC